MVLKLMLTVPHFALGGRNSYCYISRITLILVPSSREQCRGGLSLVTDSYIMCHASQTITLTEYTHVARKCLIHHVIYHVLPRDTSIPLARTFTLWTTMKLLCKKLEFNILPIKVNLSFFTKNWNSVFANFSWAHSPAIFMKCVHVELCSILLQVILFLGSAISCFCLLRYERRLWSCV